MNATRTKITSNDDLTRLRRQVLYELAVDSVTPDTVLTCVQCGAIIGFTDATQMLNVRDVDCPQCGTFNTLQAA